MVLEVYLHNFVAQTEHDGVASSHPLLHVDGTCRWLRGVVAASMLIFLSVLVRCALLSRARLEVALEVLQKRHLLLKLFGELADKT